LKWVAFPLHPEVPEGGVTLEKLFAGRGLDVAGALDRLAAKAAELGLPFSRPPVTFNSRRAQELGKWVEEQGRGEEFHLAMFQAYFVRGENLALWPVLEKAVRSLDLDPARARQALDSGAYAPAVDRDWQYSGRVGVQAVPSFRAGGRMLVGAQPWTKLTRLVEEAGMRPRQT
jgi:predicted DsbA family dithiol-disulfide isomerase